MSCGPKSAVRQTAANSLIHSTELATKAGFNRLNLHLKAQTENNGVGGSIPPLGTISSIAWQNSEDRSADSFCPRVVRFLRTRTLHKIIRRVLFDHEQQAGNVLA
jgi:hypothetical protein